MSDTEARPQPTEAANGLRSSAPVGGPGGRKQLQDPLQRRAFADRLGSRSGALSDPLARVAHGPPLQRRTTGLPSGPPIQRAKQDVIVTGLTHMVHMPDRSIYEGTEAGTLVQGQELVIETSSKLMSRRGPNQEEHRAEDRDGPQHYAWYNVLNIDGKAAGPKLYARDDVFIEAKKQSGGSKLDDFAEGADAVMNVPATLIGNEGISGAADALNDKTVHTRTSGGKGASDSDKTHAKNMGITGDTITGVTGLLLMAKGFKDLGDPDATAADLVERGLQIETGAMKTGEAVSKLTHTAKGSDNPTDASRFGSAFEGYAAAFQGIHEAFQGMRKLVDVIKNAQDYSTEDKVRVAGEIALHALETGKSIVLSVKSFIELVDKAGASGSLMASVPGLGIAISAGKIIMEGYYLIQSNASRKVMNERRKAIAKESGKDIGELDAATEEFRKVDAEIANKKKVIEDDEARYAKSGDSRLKKRIKKLKKEVAQLEKQKAAKNGLTRDNVGEFAMATELRNANKKRVTRQVIHIATEFTKIAGEIAILTGAGALGGAIVKGAAASVDLALPVVRGAKQMGRDRAARKAAKGKSDKVSAAFDASKATAAKRSYRVQQVKTILRLIVELAYKDPKTDRAAFDNVAGYLRATGIHPPKLMAANGDPQKQLQMLVEAIQKREFI